MAICQKCKAEFYLKNGLAESITELNKLQTELAALKKLPGETPNIIMDKIELYAKMSVHIGKISSVMDGMYKAVYAKRKYEQAIAHTQAQKDKVAISEISVKTLRDEEGQAYEDMNRWRNAIASNENEMNALKMKLRGDFADGTQGGNYVQSQPRSQTLTRAK